VLVVYFFEGNDLNNNMAFLERRVEKSDADGLVDRIDSSINAYPAALSGTTEGWWQHFPLLRFSYRILCRIYAERGGGAAGASTPDIGGGPAAALSGQPNLVDVAGQPVPLPANLQSPALELTRPELERAVLVFERSLIYLRKLFAGA